LKPEQWGSPLVQEKYQEEKACDKRHPYRIIMIIIIEAKISRYRPCATQKLGRGIALLFHDRGTRKEVSGQQHAPAALYPWERHGTHFTGG